MAHGRVEFVVYISIKLLAPGVTSHSNIVARVFDLVIISRGKCIMFLIFLFFSTYFLVKIHKKFLCFFMTGTLLDNVVAVVLGGKFNNIKLLTHTEFIIFT